MRRRAFTLVELLVVVSIILILVSLMLPSMKSAVNMADEAVCSSNLHQQGIALVAYVASYRFYPGCHGNCTGGASAVWVPRIREFGAESNAFYCPAEPPGWQWQTITGPPGSTDAFGRSYASQSDVDQWKYRLGETVLKVSWVTFSYGYNDWGAQGASGSDTLQRGLGGDIRFAMSVNEVPYTRVRQPSQMIAVADVTNTGGWRMNIDPTNPVEMPSDIHRGGARYLFCDGHVEWHLKDEMTGFDNPGALTLAQREIAKLWNNTNYWNRDVTPP